MSDEDRAKAYDFKKHCAECLPKAMELLQRAAEQALKKKTVNVHNSAKLAEFFRDSVHGRPAQTIQGAGGGPLVVSFTQMLGKVDGDKGEKL